MDASKWERALVGLTPGGSEFVGDPERCTQHLLNRFETLVRLFKEKMSEITELRAAHESALHTARAEAYERCANEIDSDGDMYEDLYLQWAAAERAEAERKGSVTP